MYASTVSIKGDDATGLLSSSSIINKFLQNIKDNFSIPRVNFKMTVPENGTNEEEQTMVNKLMKTMTGAPASLAAASNYAGDYDEEYYDEEFDEAASSALSDDKSKTYLASEMETTLNKVDVVSFQTAASSSCTSLTR